MTELRGLPERLLRNYVRAYEDGRVQQRPRLRFVDAEGRTCVVGAMAGAATSRELAATDLFASFRSSPLLEISRAFEAGRLSPEGVYDACLLELARRSGRDRDATARSADPREEEAAGV